MEIRELENILEKYRVIEVLRRSPQGFFKYEAPYLKIDGDILWVIDGFTGNRTFIRLTDIHSFIGSRDISNKDIIKIRFYADRDQVKLKMVFRCLEKVKVVDNYG